MKELFKQPAIEKLTYIKFNENLFCYSLVLLKGLWIFTVYRGRKIFYLTSMKDIEGNNREEEAQRIAYLTAGFIKRTLSDAEHDELDAWITASDANQRLFEELISPEGIAKGLQERNAIDTEAALQKIKEQIRFQPKEEKKGKLFQLFYRVAAAVVLIAGGYLIYTMMNRKPNDEQVTVQTNAIQPGGNYALLTLGNGKQIRLADMKNGLIDSTDGSEVLKVADGQLSYVDNQQSNEEQHLLTTPIGGQYNVLLPDGSRVWLNAASSLKYPVSFHGKERVVELTGEGYFEVKPLAPKGVQEKMPFIVKVNGIEVEVVGTHFNINAYKDDAVIRTTLLEGSVYVRHETVGVSRQSGGVSEEVILQPGEQAVAAANGVITLNKAINTEEIIAWKNGWFYFKDASIEFVLQQAARWYNIEVVYQTKINQHFNAEVLRSESIEKLLKLLELTGAVHFNIKNKTIYVLP